MMAMKSVRNAMRYTLPASVALAAALSLSAFVQGAEPAPVPIEQADYHVPAMRNDLVTILWVDIPGGRTANYHVHSKDMACVVISDYPPEGYSQPLGGPPKSPRRPERGEVSYVPYFHKAPEPHKVVNGGTLSAHSICAQLNSAKPYGFKASQRTGGGYSQVLDNPRVRAWRLILEPGQAAPAITQSAPGLRIVVQGGEIAELVPGRAQRGIAARDDHFYWQDRGITRAVRNIGTRRVELVEFEFK